MNRSVELRDWLRATVATLPGFNFSNVVLGKRDRVECGRLATVYLGRMSSEPDTMDGWHEYQQEFTVSIFITATDAEAELCQLFEQLHQKIQQEFFRSPALMRGVQIHFPSVQIHHDPSSQGRVADLHATFIITFHKN